MRRILVEQSRCKERIRHGGKFDQLRRLYQLDLQAAVAAALREPEVITKLKLTDIQRDQIRTIEQQEMARWRAGHQRKLSQTGDELFSGSCRRRQRTNASWNCSRRKPSRKPGSGGPALVLDQAPVSTATSPAGH
jgi:hypothetical protein